eukprot:13223095-Ditylum_brightwellii.AAC.1
MHEPSPEDMSASEITLRTILHQFNISSHQMGFKNDVVVPNKFPQILDPALCSKEGPFNEVYSKEAT